MAKTEKSPAFQFYPKDFITDDRVAMMSNEEIGTYIKLLCFDWINDGIPEDKMILLNMVNGNGTINDVEGWFAMVQGCFIPHPKKDGMVTNPRLLKERIKQDEWRKKSVAGGKISGKIRRKTSIEPPFANGSNQMATTPPTKCEPNSNSSSSSSSSSSVCTKTDPPTPLKGGASASLPPFLDPTTWQDFLDMRKKKRCPTTPKAIQLIFQKLKKLLEVGNDPNAVLDQSIVRGWTGVFQLPESDKFSKSNFNPSEEKTLTTYVPLGDHPDKNDPKPLPHFQIKPKLEPPTPTTKKILSLLEIKTLPIPPDSQLKKITELKKIETLQKRGIV